MIDASNLHNNSTPLQDKGLCSGQFVVMISSRSLGLFETTKTALLLLFWLAGMTPELVRAEEAPPATEGEKLFALRIKPIFAEKCNACHGDEPDKLKGGLDMRTREGLLRGGDTFAMPGGAVPPLPIAPPPICGAPAC